MVLVTAVVVGLLCTIYLLARPAVALAVLAVLLPINGILTQLIGEGSTATAAGAVKDAVLVLLLVGMLARGGLAKLPPALVLAVLAFVLLGAGAMLKTSNLEQALYGWRNDFYPALILLAVPPLLTARSARWVAVVIAGAAQVAAVIAIVTWRRGLDWLLQLGILPPAQGEQFPFQYFIAGSVEPRAFSPYGAPNEAGLAAVITIAVILCQGRWSPRRRAMLIVLPICMLGATQSRSAILGLAVLLGVLAARRLRLRYPRSGAAPALITVGGGLALVGAYAFVVAGGADSSFIGHAASLQEAGPLLVQHPFGSGVGTVGPRAIRYEADPILVESFWLLIAIEAGALALIALIAILCVVVRRGLRGRTLEAFLAPAALAGALVSQLVLPTLQDGAVSFTLYLAIALGLFHARQSEAPDIEVDPTATGSIAAREEPLDRVDGRRSTAGRVPRLPDRRDLVAVDRRVGVDARHLRGR